MDLERSFRVSSLLLLASGFTGLTLAAQLPWGLVLLGCAALGLTLTHEVGWAFHSQALRLSRVSTEVWNVLMVVAFLACAADLIWLSQDLLLAGINFLVVLMVHKVFNLHHRRDFLYLYTISFLQLLATAALTVEPWYAVVFVTYLLAAIWTMLLYHLRSEAEEVRAQGGLSAAAPSKPLTATFFWTTNGIAVATLVLTLAIFFVIPRAGAGFFQKSRGQPIRTSGFSQTVDLGLIGRLKLDPTVVMRVEFPDQQGPHEGRVYLKGAGFDLYTSRSWINTLTRRRTVRQPQPDTFLVSQTSGGRRMNSVVRQDILIEALDAPVLFGVPNVQSVKGHFYLLQTDEIGGLHLPYPPSRRFQYQVLSVPNPIQPEDRDAVPRSYPKSITKRYLQLPPLSPRVANLAKEVTRKVHSPYEQAIAIKWHLLGGYKYSLDLGETVPSSPVEEFLFIRKTGYCEHYATAMVLMLRTLGIPARLVTGFLAGEWNDFGNYYTVRQKDAHAWVEVFFPRSGWVIFDPTPSVLSTTANSSGWMLARMMDSFGLKWTRLVIQYSHRDQQAALQDIRERSRSARSGASDWLTMALKSIKNWRAWFAVRYGTWDQHDVMGWAGSLVTIALLVFLWKRRRRGILGQASSSSTAQQLAATNLYSRMLRALAAHGLSKPPEVAPLEFAGHLSTTWAEVDPVVRPLTELYCRGRFGAIPLSAEELRRADGLLATLRILLGTGRNSRAGARRRLSWTWRSGLSGRWWKLFKE